MKVNGKTGEEWISQISEALCVTSLFHDGEVQDRSGIIKFYFNKHGGLLGSSTVDILKEINDPLSEKLKDELDIDDNWSEEYIQIESESLLQLLFFMDRESLLSVVKDMINCLCK